MRSPEIYALIFALAAVLSYCANHAARRAAFTLKIVDTPGGYKTHAVPTPYLGGGAVAFSVLFTFPLGGQADGAAATLAVGVLLLCLVGTLDDKRGLPMTTRVGIECILALAASRTGLGWHLGLGPACDAAATCLWYVCVINALNLFDNIDGAAAGVVLVAGLSCAAAGVAESEPLLLGLSLSVCGACLGFLPHNLASPARIFLGDGGSLPLGFVLAALASQAANASVRGSPRPILVAVLLVGVPVIDTALVVISRCRRSVPMWLGGRDHLSHRMRGRLSSDRRVAALLAGGQAVLGGLTVAVVESAQTLLVLWWGAYCATVIGTITVAERRWHGAHESRTDELMPGAGA